jgi:hypothetical protein
MYIFYYCSTPQKFYGLEIADLKPIDFIKFFMICVLYMQSQIQIILDKIFTNVSPHLFAI